MTATKKAIRRPMKKTSKEKMALDLFIVHISSGPYREYVFHPTRKWRFDYAFPTEKIAIEYEGGVFIGGGHTRGLIYGQNCEKYNEAAIMGWAVLRFTAPMIRAKLHEKHIQQLLDERNNLDKAVHLPEGE